LREELRSSLAAVGEVAIADDVFLGAFKLVVFGSDGTRESGSLARGARIVDSGAATA